MRPHPLTPRARDLDNAYGQRCLKTIAHLRRERTRVLCSRITEVALGGSRDSIEAKARTKKQIHTPVHVVVVEDLRGFTTSQTYSRRQNVRLMTWAHAELRDNLEQACELHGLPLRTVVAAYTSQEDGRNGASGIRVTDVPVATFLEAPWWRDSIDTALRHRHRNVATEEDRLILAWWSRWDEQTGIWIDEHRRRWSRRERRWMSHTKNETSPPAIVLPDVEGPLFISLAFLHPVSATTNAAITIASKVLLDPDWPGAWSHVGTQNGVPLAESVRGAVCFRDVKQLGDFVTPSAGVVNAWRRRSAQPIGDGVWQQTRTYLANVREEISRQLRIQLDRRLVDRGVNLRQAVMSRDVASLLSG
jgi:IS605 OrfB family transposase